MLNALRRHPLMVGTGEVLVDTVRYVAMMLVVLLLMGQLAAVALDAARFLVGERLSDATIAEAATLAARHAKPMDNTDFTLHWRKRVGTVFATLALREVRGDDVREARRRIARHDLATV